MKSYRGAGDSTGRTSWTGKPELQDYISFTGFMIYYLHVLNDAASSDSLPQALSNLMPLLLAGYSYGSLTLARFPSTSELIKRFETAERGTAPAGIIMRARTLARQTRQAVPDQQSPASPRGRTLKPEQSPTTPSKRVSPMTVGGEETDPAERRRSRDSRRSVDVIRKSVEAPRRMKAHIKHRHVSRETPHAAAGDEPASSTPTSKPPTANPESPHAPDISTSYFFIWPALLPFSSTLLTPGAPAPGFSTGQTDAASHAKQYLQHPTPALFGSSDAFTSSKRLRHWAEKQASQSHADFVWDEIAGAGHFWGELGALPALRESVRAWVAGEGKA